MRLLSEMKSSPRVPEAVALRFACEHIKDVAATEWDALARCNRPGNLFYDRVFVEAACHAWPEAAPTTIVTGRLGATLVFLLPCRIVDSMFGRMFEVLEIPTADRVEALTGRQDRELILAKFRNYLLDVIRPDMLVARSLTRDFRDQLGMIRRGATFRQHPRPLGWMLALPDSLDGFWSSCSANFRSQLRRKMRKAEAEGISFRVVTEDTLPAGYDMIGALANLTRLHRMRFESMKRRSFFVRPPFQAFHEYICTQAGTGAAIVSFTEALHEGRVIGSLYGARTQDMFLYVMIGFDPEYAAFSPGSLLIYHTVESLIGSGVGWFDFKCGDEPYKVRWSSGSYEKFDLEIAFTGRGRLLRFERAVVDGLRRMRNRTVGAPTVLRAPPSRRLGRQLTTHGT